MSWRAGHLPTEPPLQPGTKASIFGWGVRDSTEESRQVEAMLRAMMLKGLNVTTASCVTPDHPRLTAFSGGSAYPRYYCTDASADVGSPCLGDRKALALISLKQ